MCGFSFLRLVLTCLILPTGWSLVLLWFGWLVASHFSRNCLVSRSRIADGIAAHTGSSNDSFACRQDSLFILATGSTCYRLENSVSRSYFLYFAFSMFDKLV